MTRPAYSSARSTIYFGDNLPALAALPTESVGLVVTDPPYGCEWESGVRAESFGPMQGDGAGDREAVREALTHCVRLVGQNRHLYVFGPIDVLEGQKVSEPVELIWDKGVIGSGPLAAPWGPGHENISFVVSKHRHGGQAGNSALAARLRKASVLRHPRPTGRKVRHPSEKPVPLLTELIESSSRVGETVLDPYAGSGSTAVAAILAGRKVITMEKDKAYFGLILRRVKAAEALADQMAGV